MKRLTSRVSVSTWKKIQIKCKIIPLLKQNLKINIAYQIIQHQRSLVMFVKDRSILLLVGTNNSKSKCHLARFAMKGGQVHEPGQNKIPKNICGIEGRSGARTWTIYKRKFQKLFCWKNLNIHLQTKVDDQWKTLASNTEKAGGMKHLSNNHDLQMIWIQWNKMKITWHL